MYVDGSLSTDPTAVGTCTRAGTESVPLEGEAHLLTALRYVEANAVRAGLVDNAVDWRVEQRYAHAGGVARSHPWPVSKPSDWLALLNNKGTGPLST